MGFYYQYKDNLFEKNIFVFSLYISLIYVNTCVYMYMCIWNLKIETWIRKLYNTRIKTFKLYSHFKVNLLYWENYSGNTSIWVQLKIQSKSLKLYVVVR